MILTITFQRLEQEILSRSEHRFWWGLICSIVNFRCSILSTIVGHFFSFFFFLDFYFILALAIVLFVLRKVTSSGYLFSIFKLKRSKFLHEGCRCRDRMVVKFTTTYAISAYHH